MIDTHIELVETFLLRRHLILFQSSNRNDTILFLANAHLFHWLASDFVARHRCWVQQVVQLLVVELKERDLDLELRVLGLGASQLQLVENKFEDARNYTNLLKWHAKRATCSHGVRLARSSLTVRQDGRIEAMEAAEYEVPRARVKNVLLRCIIPKHLIEYEALDAYLNTIAVLISVWLLDAHFAGTFCELATDERPNSDRYSD